ncbi:MAG: helix-turn-helix domain-containing protein [Rudaea sp.]
MPKTIHRREYRLLIRSLREARERTGKTQSDIAQAVGKRQTWISEIEIGSRRMDVIELRDICRALDVDMDKFLRRFERALTSGT